MTTSRRTGEKTVPVLYLDLDGTVRKGKDELGRFVNGPEDVELFPEVPDLLAAYKDLGWRIIGCSNQGGIALGHMTMQQCLAGMAKTQKLSGNAFDKILWCSHHPDAEDPEMAVCWCRKPKAGLVIEGALNLKEQYKNEIYPPHLGLFVGDRPEDEGCAENAGLRFMPAKPWRKGIHLDLVVAEALKP
jgi:D-glycero-D-manno-heptose 1,7-bisphosphate phosphatase